MGIPDAFDRTLIMGNGGRGKTWLALLTSRDEISACLHRLVTMGGQR